MKLFRSSISLTLALLILIFSSCSEESASSNEVNTSSAISDVSESGDVSQQVSQSSEGASSEEDVSGDGKYADEGELKLRIFKMGKSDAYLFRTSSKTVLIDCGDSDDSQEILDYFTEKAIDKIDYLLLTHLDKKSIGGAASLISSLEIGTIYEPDYEKSNTTYLEYASALNDKGLTSVKVNSVTTFEIDGVAFTITPCEKSYYSDDNNYSSTISVVHGNNSFLFVGDAKSERISEIITMENIKHDFLMLPDNGALDPKTSDLINSVQPEIAVITCSEKNPASADVLKILSDKGISTYLTSAGSIRITSDGTEITAEQ